MPHCVTEREMDFTTHFVAPRASRGKLPLLFSQALFREAVVRERRRAERTGLPLVLLAVSLEGGRYADSPSIWECVGEVLSACRPETSIVGWLENNAVLGLIVPDVVSAVLGSTCENLEGQVRKGLAERIDSETIRTLSIRVRVYPEPQWLGEGEERQVMDPHLYPDLHARRTKTVVSQLLKRCVDVLGSAVLLVALFPLLALIAGLVKATSRGPIFFRQVRIGQMMKPFMICKFRTMYANADHGIHQNYVSWFITSSNKGHSSEKNKVFKLTNDPRITPIGHFLRTSSLDELPQLWNVLVGDMSLVGPRPPLWYEVEQYKPWHRHRILEAKPGITGLWQVFGRSRTTFDEMVRLDLEYARTQSLWTDIKILLATPGAVISRKGAC